MKELVIAMLILGMFCIGAYALVIEPVLMTMGYSLPF